MFSKHTAIVTFVTKAFVFLSLDLGPDIHLPRWFVHLRRVIFLISNFALRFDVEWLKETLNISLDFLNKLVGYVHS